MNQVVQNQTTQKFYFYLRMLAFYQTLFCQSLSSTEREEGACFFLIRAALILSGL